MSGFPMSILKSWFIPGLPPVYGPELEVWMDGIDSSTVVLTTSASSARVTTWVNKGFAPGNFTQDFETAPTYSSSNPLAKPGMIINGGEGMARVGFPRTVFTTFTVYLIRNIGAQTVIYYSGNGGANGHGILDFSGAGSQFHGSLFGGVAFAPTNIPVVLNRAVYVTCRRQADSLFTQSVNGMVGYSAGVGMNPPSNQLGFGSFFFEGVMFEMLMYNRALTTAEVADTHTWLSNKWGISPLP